MTRWRRELNDQGYLLPVVIALGFAISVVSFSALSALSQNSKSLNAQYYSQLAAEAANAGTTAAIKCIEASTIDWDTGSNPKLAPGTDCHGTTVSGRPTTVFDDGSVQTTYSVAAIQSPYGGNTARVIASTGTATLKTASGTATQTFTKTTRTFGNLKTGTVTDIDSGNGNVCAVVDGSAYCWGNPNLGNNTSNNSPVPVAVDTTGVLNGKTITDISVGSEQTCVVASGKAYCWGVNSHGELGDGTINNSLVPVAVDATGALNGLTVTAISAGNNFTCAVAGGSAYCWGANSTGQLGDNSTTESHVPVAVYASGSGALKNKIVTAISAGSHTCAIANSAAYCWGYNANGRLGNNSVTDAHAPVAVTTAAGVLSGKTVTAISAGPTDTCAVASGLAYCWGYNAYGQLGNNSTTESHVPVPVTAAAGVLSGKTVTAISTGDWDSCAVASGMGYCWGQNTNGDNGDNTTSPSNVPVPIYSSGVLAGKTLTAINIDSGNGSSCAIASNQAFCWGNNTNGTIGNNSTTELHAPDAVSKTWGSYVFANSVSF